MEIVKTDFVQGAKNAEGIVVIIDVFRAFSVACYCLDSAPSFIAPVGSVESAFALKEQYPDAIIIGERNGKKLDGFDYGNSPKEVLGANMQGKVIIHTTHAGTQGLVNANKADEILTGSFLNASATAAYILSKKPEVVSLVRMGLKAEEKTDEDDLCAEYLESLLAGKPFDTLAVKERLMNSPCSERFFDPQRPSSPEDDFHLCLDIDKFDFAVTVEKQERGFLKLRKETCTTQ